MFLKNSIKGLYRTPFKSIFLILLLGITTFIWELGMSTYVDIERFLEDCDDLYVTLGELEYVVPDQLSETTEADCLNNALNSEFVSNLSRDNSVLFAESSKEYFCNIDGYKRTDSFTEINDKALVVVTGAIYQEEYDRYQARVKECLFAHKDMKGSTVLINADIVELDSEKDYVIFAEVHSDISPMNFLFPVNYSVVKTGDEIEMIYALEDEEEFPQIYYSLAETLAVVDNGVAIYPTENMESLHLFHQNILYIEEGRLFSEEEYREGEKVCVINGIVANRLEKKVGDYIELSWLDGGKVGFWNNYWSESGFDHTEEYKIVGITNVLNAESFKVFVPNNPELFTGGETIDGEVLRMIIDNRSAADFVETVREKKGDYYRFSVYDQGYAETVSAYISVQYISRIIVWSVSVLCIAAMLLIVYISIIKQREASITMLRLGSKKNQVLRYNIYAGTILGLFGVIAGTFAAIISRERVYDWIEKTAGESFKIDFRFSDFNQSMQRKSIDFNLATNANIFILFALILFAFLFIVVLLFSIHFSKTKSHGRHKMKVHIPNIQRHMCLKSGNGFVWRQVFRNRSKTLGVIVLGIAVAIFLGEILHASTLSEENLDYLLENEEMHGIMVDYNGSNDFDLILDIEDMEILTNISRLEEIDGMTSEKYLYAGISKDKNGEEKNYESIQVPAGFEGFTVLKLQYLQASDLVFTTSLKNTEEFFYVNEFDATYLDGYDESFLGESYNGELYGMISDTMAREEEIELGETIVVSPLRGTRNGFLEYHIKVIGLFHSGFNQSNIYCPLDAVLDTSFLRDEEDLFDGMAFGETKEEYRINNVMVEFKGIKEISDLKNQLTNLGLEETLEAGENRKFIVLGDGVALSNLNGLRMQDQYTRILMILMIVLCAGANLFFSTLLLRGQKSKIGIMLSLGSTFTQTYIAFCWDLILLYFLGNGIGILIVWRVSGAMSREQLLVLLLVGVVYILGASVSLIKIAFGNLSKHMKNIDE